MFANNKEYLNPEDYIKFIKNELLPVELKDIATKLIQIELEKFISIVIFNHLIYFNSFIGFNRVGSMFQILNYAHLNKF